MSRSKRFVYRVRVCKNEVLRNLHLSDDFNVCLEAIYLTVERFNERCVPLTFSQIIKLKVLHSKIWNYSLGLCDSV